LYIHCSGVDVGVGYACVGYACVGIGVGIGTFLHAPVGALKLSVGKLNILTITNSRINTEKIKRSKPDTPAVNDSLAETNFSELPDEDIYKNPEYTIKRKDIPPPTPKAQRKINATNSVLFLTGTQPIAVFISHSQHPSCGLSGGLIVYGGFTPGAVKLTQQRGAKKLQHGSKGPLFVHPSANG
jgi:hypothetical protein